MAIDRRGQVTTTGLMGGEPKLPKAPDMRGLSAQTKTQPPQTTQTAQTQQVPEDNISNKLTSLTDEEKIAIDAVLSPSIVGILKKIAPEAGPLLDQFGSNEENVTLPISVVRQYAIKIYGGDEKQAIENFIADLSGSQQMENNNVPLDTTQASPEGGMLAQEPDTSETDAIDQGLA